MRKQNRSLSFVILSLAAAAALLMIPAVTRAEIVWYADFESYADGETINTNAALVDDTMTQFTGGKGTNVHTAVSAGLGTGNAMKMWIDSPDNPTNGAVKRLGMNFGDNSVMIVSYDARLSQNFGVSFDFVADDGGRAGTTAFNNHIRDDLRRITAIANQSGGTIDLPSGMGTLGDDQMALYYRRTAGTFALVGILDFKPTYDNETGSYVTGFTMIQAYVTDETKHCLYDNLLVSDTLDEKYFRVGGEDYSILELPPGAQLSDMLPEPATMGLLVLGGIGVLLKRRRNPRA